MSLPNNSRPIIVTILIILFCFGAIMSSLATFTLLFPENPLSIVWKVNPKGHEGFRQIGNWSYLILSAVLVACATCALGLLYRRPWGYLLAIGLLIANSIGDFVNVFFIKEYRAAVGFPVAAVLLWLLFRSRKYFSP